MILNAGAEGIDETDQAFVIASDKAVFYSIEHADHLNQEY
jgi:hypothetical protein